MAPEDRIGKQYGDLKIIGIDRTKKGRVYWCRCEVCGQESNYSLGELKEVHKCNHVSRYGKYINWNMVWKNKRLGAIFRGMKRRCYSKNDKEYRFYGEKGIDICYEWLDDPHQFEDWALSHGYADDLTIDRIDSGKGYSPDNCRWISQQDNSRYKSTTSLIDVDGESHTGRDWAGILGLGCNMINKYIRKHGVENTTEFIRRYRKNPELRDQYPVQKSLYSTYMNEV